MGQYAALSYCWGGSQTGTLTGKNYNDYKNGLDLSKLSRTLQHAIQFTRSLDVLYLWVDALCIMQDDVSDEEIGIHRMSDIYRNAFVTIVVSSSASAENGFLHNRLRDLPGTVLPIRENMASSVLPSRHCNKVTKR